MTKRRKKNSYLKHYLLSPIREFINDSRAVGIVLVVCTVISLSLANSPWSTQYLHFWELKLSPPIAGMAVPKSLTHFINDALMALFFLLVGLEIKREMLQGELSSYRKSALPVFAAIGGMLVPAGIYFLWNFNSPFAHGWGIPMATDIAFSLGILSLLGKRVPLSLQVLLTALAIIDDLGAIIVIAIFYAAHISVLYLALAALLTAVLVVFNLCKVKRLYLYFIVGIGLWYCLFNSGVHPTLSGVILAFTIPLERIPKLEHELHDPVNFIILPLFALANTAFLLPDNLQHIFSDTAIYGVVMGLVIGKPLGIFIASFFVVKIGIAQLPKGLKWDHIWGMGLIAGIGFTMSIFITMLAFRSAEAQDNAKIAILVASLLSALIGYFLLKRIIGHKSISAKN